MTTKRTFVLSASAITVAIAFALFAAWYLLVPRMGNKVIEKCETENSRFRIRVTAYQETGGFISGAYYVFDSAPKHAQRWSKILRFRHDDPVKIPRNQVRFVNDSIAYVFMGWMYAVTTDSGGSWSVWDAERDLPGWRCCNYGLIKDITISSDGSGTMECNFVRGRLGEVPKLETTDYGRTWRALAIETAEAKSSLKLQLDPPLQR